MALQSSGAISLNDIHVEAGGSSGTQASINDSDIRGLIDKSSGATMSFNEWYGSGTFRHTISSNTQELSLTSTYFTNLGWSGIAEIELTIASGIYIWSNSTSTAGLTISSSLSNKSLTIINNGYIIGKGGNGGAIASAGSSGGPAISNSASGVSITNASGAYIAGGGGGGGGRTQTGTNSAGGGGGAGGGSGSAGLGGSVSFDAGANGRAGGYGGGYYNGTTYAAQGGGWDLPGTGGSSTGLSSGGSGGNAGQDSTGSNISGGGGGWGASGGAGSSHSGGSGGAAISGTSITVTNNGTIYGSQA